MAAITQVPDSVNVNCGVPFSYSVRVRILYQQDITVCCKLPAESSCTFSNGSKNVCNTIHDAQPQNVVFDFDLEINCAGDETVIMEVFISPYEEGDQIGQTRLEINC